MLGKGLQPRSTPESSGSAGALVRGSLCEAAFSWSRVYTVARQSRTCKGKRHMYLYVTMERFVELSRMNVPG